MFNKSRGAALAVGVLTAGWSGALQAQGAGPEVATPTGAPAALSPIVISGSRQAQPVAELPATIDVVDAEDLERRQAQDIREALQSLPNVSVRRSPARYAPIGGASTGRDANASVNIRGLEGNRVLLLVDGVRTPRSYAFGANAFGRDYFATDLLQRIEVVRGPASVLYGSDGIGGLVNFITLSPDEWLGANRVTGSEPRRFAARVSASYSGDDHGRQLAATLAGRVSDTSSWLLSATTGRSEALDNQGVNDAPNLNRTTPNPQSDRRQALLAKWVLTPGAGQRHTLTLEAVERTSDIELLSSRATVLNATATLRATSAQRQSRERLTWQGRFQPDQPWADRVDTLLSWQSARSRDQTLNDRNTAADQIRDMRYTEGTWQAGLQASLSRPLGDWGAHRLTYGIDLTRTEVQNLLTGQTPAAGEAFPIKRFPDTVESAQGLYVQSDITTDRLSLTPALRLEHFDLRASQTGFAPPATSPAASLSGSALVPKLGAVWRATPQWSLFGSLAAGFKAPNASQVNAYFENFGPFAFYRTIPNPNLKPEKSRNLELGVRGQVANLQLEAVVFGGRYTDFIEDNATVGGAGVAGNPTIFQSINIAKARITGLELKGQLQLQGQPQAGWSLPFAFGLTRGTNVTSGKPLNSVEPARLMVALQRQSARADLRLELTRHAAKSSDDIDSAGLVTAPAIQFATPAATTLDLTGQWRPKPGLRVNVGLINLTDRTYWRWTDVRGVASGSGILDAFTQPGRHLNVSLVADF